MIQDVYYLNICSTSCYRYYEVKYRDQQSYGQTSIYAFFALVSLCSTISTKEYKKEQNPRQEGEIHHETGRSRGCASVFL